MKNSSLYIGLILMMMQVFSLHAQNKQADQDIWNKANTFYTAKKYDSAISYYLQLEKQHAGNAFLQYNMGNTYFRLNKIGASILHYERAKQLDPGSQWIDDNLLVAKGKIMNPLPEATPIFFISWWNNLIHVFGTNAWAVLSLLAFIVVLALMYFANSRKEQFKYSGRWLSLSIVCLILTSCITWFSYENGKGSGRAVVLQPATNFRDAAAPNAKILGMLPEGTVIEVTSSKANYYKVILPNGREGWINREDAQEI